MRLCLLVIASTVAIALFGAAGAAGAPEDSVRWEDFDDPAFDPALPAVPTETVAPATVASAGVPPRRMSDRAKGITIGPRGVDADGVEGRIHLVEPHETLWDISDAYLGTPWVWPSVWDENDDIANPHIIQPGDRIWITANEMRLITAEEAETFVGQSIADDVEDEPVVAALEEDGAPEEVPAPEETELEELPSLAPMAEPIETAGTLQVPPDQRANIVDEDELDAAAELVDSPSIRVMLTQGDEAYLDLGEGEVGVGDEFTVFRDVTDIRDPKTRALLGHYVDELGWVRVESIDGEWCTARIVEATDEIQRGDRLIPRERLESEVAVRMADPQLVGQIALTPGWRELAGTQDSVYLNVGSLQGVELGTKLQVYSGTAEGVDLLGAVVAEMVVIKVEPEVSAAYVTEARRELQVGDVVRGPRLRRQAAYSPD